MTTYLKINPNHTKELFHQYLRLLKKKNLTYNKHYPREVFRRFKQIQYLLELISGLTEKERLSKHIRIPSEKLWLFVETFYYVTFRTRNVLRTFPGLSRFECVGIRDVRNHLIEHPESKSSGIFEESFSWGRSYGPILKARRRQQFLFSDKGLYINYLEFQDTLDKKLEQLLTTDDL